MLSFKIQVLGASERLISEFMKISELFDREWNNRFVLIKSKFGDPILNHCHAVLIGDNVTKEDSMEYISAVLEFKRPVAVVSFDGDIRTSTNDEIVFYSVSTTEEAYKVLKEYRSLNEEILF